MKYISAVLMFVIWVIATFLILCTIIGILLFVFHGDEWMEVLFKILKVFEE